MLTAVVAAAVEEARWQAMARFMDTSSFLGEDSTNLQWQFTSIVFKNSIVTVQTQLTDTLFLSSTA